MIKPWQWKRWAVIGPDRIRYFRTKFHAEGYAEWAVQQAYLAGRKDYTDFVVHRVRLGVHKDQNPSRLSGGVKVRRWLRSA